MKSSSRKRLCQNLHSKFLSVTAVPVLRAISRTTYCCARSLKAGELRYRTMPPATAPMTSATITKNRMMRRLFKNLNLALPAYRFQPDINLVVQSFLKHIATDRIRDAFEGRNGR